MICFFCPSILIKRRVDVLTLKIDMLRKQPPIDADIISKKVNLFIFEFKVKNIKKINENTLEIC